MGLLDLSTSASAKKHVDLNDARYQLVDKLKSNDKKNIRPTFTLYDNKELGKVTTKEISAAYDLSDKKLPMGELMNKMVDMVVDLEDGILNSEKDCIYAWKYAVTIIAMYEDKINNKRQNELVSFDNGLKNLVLSSKEFAEHYPGRYTSRTNFFDTKIKNQLILDIIEIFKHAAAPKLHELAIEKSKVIAEKHDNPTLNRIIQWAIDNYKCTVDSYFDIKVDPDTSLYYALNTVILHLKNGYDMSIVGFVGTDHDDRFAISAFNTNDANMERFDDKLETGDVQSNINQIVELEKVSPMHRILKVEQKRKEELNAQLEYLRSIRPMVDKELLDLQVAVDVVGEDYLWSCERNRKIYPELKKGFTFDDLKIPEITATRKDVAMDEEIVSGLAGLDDSASTQQMASTPFNEAVANYTEEVEVSEPETVETEESNETVTDVASTTETVPVVETAPVAPEATKEPAVEDLFATTEDQVDDDEDEIASMFDAKHQPDVIPSKPVVEEKPAVSSVAPAMPVTVEQPQVNAFGANKSTVFNDSAILLPGVMIDIDGDGIPDVVPSYTGFAVQAKTEPETPDTQLTWVEPEQTAEAEDETASEMKEKVKEAAALVEDKEEKVITPDLMFDNIDSLFE